jgi:hypothetical protein
MKHQLLPANLLSSPASQAAWRSFSPADAIKITNIVIMIIIVIVLFRSLNLFVPICVKRSYFFIRGDEADVHEGGPHPCSFPDEGPTRDEADLTESTFQTGIVLNPLSTANLISSIVIIMIVILMAIAPTSGS